MKNEEESCTILKNSIKEMGGIAIKIPDPTNAFQKTIARPFDLFGAFNNVPWYCEVKFQKGVKSFNLQRIDEHQIEFLCEFKTKISNSQCWIVLAIKVGRGDNRFYIFSDPFMIKKRRDKKENFIKKEIDLLPYFSVKKGLIDLTNYQGDVK